MNLSDEKMFYQIALLDKKAAILFLRTETFSRGTFKEVLMAYLRVMDKLDEIVGTEYQPNDFFFESLDRDLLKIAEAVDCNQFVEDLTHSLEHENEQLEKRVKEKMEKMNENKK